MRVITNHQPRDIIDAAELTAVERAAFDYLDWAAIDEGRESGSFFRYKGKLYDIGEFTTVERSSSLATAWSGIHTDTFFSAVVIHLTDDGDSVIVGYVFA